mmetsp:Transcript_8634/g.35979  ORF Transcript_8634/g.35979 Transcript_8634/m.35979 type:complete len:179 (-) Transcript_8634:33-569(-)
MEVVASENRARRALGQKAEYSLQDMLSISYMAANEAPLGGRLRERTAPANRMGLRPPHAANLDIVMDEFFEWLNSDEFQQEIPPVQAALMLVHMMSFSPTSEELVTAHLMANLVLRSNDLPAIGLLKANIDSSLDLGSPAVGHADPSALALNIVDAVTQAYVRINELIRTSTRRHDEL